MEKYIALLRGINVSGQMQIKMAELKLLFESLGLNNVQTYIQSGNVVFSGLAKQAAEIQKLISNKITEVYDFEVPVLVLKANDFEKVLNSNPYLQDTHVKSENLYVTLLAEDPTPENLIKLEHVDFNPDQFIIEGRNIYLNISGGYGRTKLNNNFFENKLKVTATTRNWKTIQKLSEIIMSICS